MRLRNALLLGRISNLPTVWTNTLAGILLAGGRPDDWRFPALIVSMSLFYVGGMYLNDAFDAEIDARERPERPIPAGHVARSTVFAIGFAMLGGGLLPIALIGFSAPVGAWPLVGGGLLAAAIIFYDWHHKANVLSPLVMGLCRMLVYVTAALAYAAPPPSLVVLGAILLLCHLIGLTYAAKQEHLGKVSNLWPLAFFAAPVFYGALASLSAALDPSLVFFWLFYSGWVAFALRFLVRRRMGDVPLAVAFLIAGIGLLDAMLIASIGAPGWAAIAAAGFLLTLMLQRFVPGT